MARVRLEYRPTLDDLFGPDLAAELERVASEIEELGTDARRWNDGFDGEVLAALMARADELVALTEERSKEQALPYFQVFIIQPIGGPIRISRSGGISYGPLAEEDDKATFKVYLRTGIRRWLTAHRWMLQDQAERGLKLIRRALKALAAFARVATRRSLEAIEAAISLLRRADPTSSAGPDRFPTLRDQVAELLSPHVLAAGGQCALHVPRC